MGRISATFKNSIEGMVKAYAEHYDLTFSEAVAALAGASVTMWFDKQPKSMKKILIEKYNIFPSNQKLIIKP